MIKQTKQNLYDTRVIEQLQPGSVIGILGGGQLGRMLAVAASRLGLRCYVYSTSTDNPACEVAARTIEGRYEDLQRLSSFAADVNVITYEFENIPVSTAQHLDALKPVYPPPRALEITQDRLKEKQFIENLGITVAPYKAVSDHTELSAALKTIGTPAILKIRSDGYDGKGQVRVTENTDLEQALKQLGGKPAILEGFVPFKRELSVILARGIDPAALGGYADVVYDIPVNTHANGILERTVVPAPITQETKQKAADIARKIVTALDYIGVIAVELFEVQSDGENTLIVNEIAPRVHNSGHWTMNACLVDQFENHIRAISGWPLGATTRYADVEMTNLIGDDIAKWNTLLRAPNCALHLYGKSDVRAGRKMGHFNKLKNLKS